MARYWLLRCLKTHPQCNKLQNHLPRLPTRVIDVGGPTSSEHPFLRITNGTNGLYTTLSYRWTSGGLRLKRSYLKALLKEARLNILPRIVQQAILVTKGLGIQYLWVDSLCIIQDDPADWRQESYDMEKIYRNSVLTIAAVDANSPGEGIVAIRHGPSFFSNPRRRPLGVLDTRGWTLQEQLLSSRVLSYADGELFWDCQHLTASESCPAGTPAMIDLDRRDEDVRSSRAWLNHSRVFESPSAPVQLSAYRLWRKLVEVYTARELTVPSDRAAAIHGIASAFSKRLDDVLVAGIWQKQALHHLAWRVKPRTLAEAQPNRVFPSWSWLSVNSAVTYAATSYNDYASSSASIVDAPVEKSQDSTADTSRAEDDWQVTQTPPTEFSPYARVLAMNERSVHLEGSVMQVEVYSLPGLPYCLFPLGARRWREEQRRAHNRALLNLPEDILTEDDLQVTNYSEAPPPHNRGYEPFYPDHFYRPPQHLGENVEVRPVEMLTCFHIGSEGVEGQQYSLVLRKLKTGHYLRIGFCAWNPLNVDIRHQSHRSESRALYRPPTHEAKVSIEW